MHFLTYLTDPGHCKLECIEFRIFLPHLCFSILKLSGTLTQMDTMAVLELLRAFIIQQLAIVFSDTSAQHFKIKVLELKF